VRIAWLRTIQLAAMIQTLVVNGCARDCGAFHQQEAFMMLRPVARASRCRLGTEYR
jgi:hypothetical protein